MRGALLFGLLVAPAQLSCSSSLPVPKFGPQPPEAALLQSVDYPPPPAQAEVVSKQPENEACVWLDGHWDWVGGRWVWGAGGWVVPPKDCFLARPTLSWPEAGALQLLRWHWFPDNVDELTPEKARTACATPVPCGKPAEKYRPGK
ncbi:MAG: YXWGXW repeat-containing protein [Myxococcales bacterium]|nr:YXWGXW repeat-containing protein [Myxococcales bacterium]